MKYGIFVLSVALWLPVCMSACEGREGVWLVKAIARCLNTEAENIGIARGLRISSLDNSEIVWMGSVRSPLQIDNERLYQSEPIAKTFLAKEKAGKLDPNFGAVQTVENLASLFVVMNGILRWEIPYQNSHCLYRDEVVRMLLLNVCYAKNNGGGLRLGYAVNEDGQYDPTLNTCYDIEPHTSGYWDQFRGEQ